MIQLKKALTSTVGQKFLMALSGVGLVVFTIVHLLGNLTLYQSKGTAFNTYAHTLESSGVLLVIAEVGLLGVFCLHIVTALWLKKENKTARPIGYRKWKSKGVREGEPKPSNVSSRNMVVTGSLLLGFLLLHIWQFRFGPGEKEGYVADLQGHPARDLYRLVAETFSNPLFVGIYVFVMILLGLHLRHGIWSAFQSLGVLSNRTTKTVRAIGTVTALILAIGFLFIPIWMYFGVSANLVSGSLQ